MSSPRTPYYLVDEARLLRNLEVVRDVREASGAKVVLALKCFATWSVFDLMARYLDGTTSSSVNEARLGHEQLRRGRSTPTASPSPVTRWPRSPGSPTR